jgi:hypothetical protein
MDRATVDEIIASFETAERRNKQSITRFCDLSALDAVDLKGECVFCIALD